MVPGSVSQTSNDVKHFFVYLLAFLVSFVKFLFRFFNHFFFSLLGYFSF